MRRFWCHRINKNRMYAQPGSCACTEKHGEIHSVGDIHQFCGLFSPSSPISPKAVSSLLHTLLPLRSCHSLRVDCAHSPSGVAACQQAAGTCQGPYHGHHVIAGLCGNEMIHDPRTFARRVALARLTSAEALQTHPSCHGPTLTTPFLKYID